MSGIKQIYILLSKNKNSVLFLKPFKNDLSRNEMNKLKNSNYKGDRELHKMIIDNKKKNNTEIENLNEGNNNENENENLVPIVINRRKEPIHISGMLKRFVSPYQSFQADVADLNFTNPSGSDPKYCLVCVDLFSQKIFTYGFRKKSFLPTVFERFLKDIQNDRIFFTKYNPLVSSKFVNEAKQLDIIRIQTDEEFTNNKSITKLSDPYKVHIFSSKINAGHASAAEQKIKLIKQKLTLYLQSKNMRKSNKIKILNDITININNTVVEKYGFSPNQILKELKENPELILTYDHSRMIKVTNADKRVKRMNEIKIAKNKTRLRKLKVNDLVLIPAGRIKKSDYPSVLDKVTTNKKPYFERRIIFKVVKLEKDVNNSDIVLYQVNPVTNIQSIKRKLGNEKFIKTELYAIKNNTVSLKKY